MKLIKSWHFSNFLRFGLSLCFIFSLAVLLCIGSQRVQAESFSGNSEAILFSSGQQKVFAPDGEAKDGFGYSSAISDDGSTALIGSYYIEFGIAYPIGPGGVYTYFKNGNLWELQQKLPTPEMPESDLFGYVLALSSDGNTALVGAPGGTGPAETQVPGAAFVFTRSGSTWSQQALLIASDRQVSDHFGFSVALSDDGNTALIGSYVDDVGSNANQGSAYVFTRSGSNWSEQAHLFSADGAAEDYFGRSVSLSADGNTALIGANMKMIGSNTRQGAAYIFTRSGTSWNQQKQIILADGAAYDWFGTAVTLSSDSNTALITANGHKVGQREMQGAGFIFVRSGSNWVQQAMLSAPENTVSLWGDTATLSPDGSFALIEDGYTFERHGETWTAGLRLLPEDNASGFGSSVALSGDGVIALIGANYATIGQNYSQGAAYFFDSNLLRLTNRLFLPLVTR